MSGELENKIALVTGGGTGIGEAIARVFAAAGAAVAITGRRREVLDAAAARIEADGGRALAVAGDVSRPADARRMVAETVDAWGALHVLVNNAGIARGGPLEAMSDDEVAAVIDVDFKGPIHVTRAALPELRRHRDAGGAAILNVSSSVTQTVLENYSVYSAAKAGLDHLTRCWGLEFAPDRIRVNAICPGIVETPIFEATMTQEEIDAFLARMATVTPLGRAGRPDDVARLALHLVSPQSDWLTGAVIPLDGGISLAGNV